MSEYRVHLDVFAGPLDLLLYLVRKEELDIYDIPIARITEQYLEYIEMLKVLDMDVAAEFLVMAATLLEIKSAMLLPKAETEDASDENPSDPRSVLIGQLLEYKRYKDAANQLAAAAEERQLRFTRPDSILSLLKKKEEPEIDLEQVSVWTLLEAFGRILKATGQVSSYERIRDDTPIDFYQIEILHRLQTEGAMAMESIFEGRKNRLVLIGLFLALLELIRNRLVWAEQAEPNSPIYLKPLTRVPAEEAVRKAILSEREGEGHSSQTPSQGEGESVQPQAAMDQRPTETEETEEEMEEDLFETDRPSAKRGGIPIQEIRPEGGGSPTSTLSETGQTGSAEEAPEGGNG